MGAIWLDGRTGGYLNLLDVLAAGGVSCSGYSGWEHRSRSSGGYEGLWGILCHHTASQTSPANDLSYMVNADDGPISTGLLDRTGHFTVIAAGAANHGGKGGGTSDGGGEPWHTTRGTIPGNDSNRYTLGIEAANNGVGEPWTEAQQDAYVKMVRALCSAYALDPGRDVKSHNEWTPPRKIDPRGPARWSTNDSQPWDMNLFRNEVARLEDDDMTDEERQMLREIHAAVFASSAGELPRQVWGTRIDDLPTGEGSAADLMRDAVPGQVALAVWAQKIDDLPTVEGGAADMLRDIKHQTS